MWDYSIPKMDSFNSSEDGTKDAWFDQQMSNKQALESSITSPPQEKENLPLMHASILLSAKKELQKSTPGVLSDFVKNSRKRVTFHSPVTEPVMLLDNSELQNSFVGKNCPLRKSNSYKGTPVKSPRLHEMVTRSMEKELLHFSPKISSTPHSISKYLKKMDLKEGEVDSPNIIILAESDSARDLYQSKKKWPKIQKSKITIPAMTSRLNALSKPKDVKGGKKFESRAEILKKVENEIPDRFKTTLSRKQVNPNDETDNKAKKKMKNARKSVRITKPISPKFSILHKKRTKLSVEEENLSKMELVRLNKLRSKIYSQNLLNSSYLKAKPPTKAKSPQFAYNKKKEGKLSVKKGRCAGDEKINSKTTTISQQAKRKSTTTEKSSKKANLSSLPEKNTSSRKDKDTTISTTLRKKRLTVAKPFKFATDERAKAWDKKSVKEKSKE